MNAFPSYEYMPSYNQMMAVGGMTLRDYFAAKAMQAIISDPDAQMSYQEIATSAYKYADLMIGARTK